MGEFKEFLAQEAQQQSEQAERRDRVRDEWIKDIEELLEQIKEMLKAEDEKGYLKVERTTHKIRESRLGTYTAPGLRITLGNKEVLVVPQARYPIGSVVGDPYGTSIRHGRVDLSRDGSFLRFMIYRRLDPDSQYRWIIADNDSYFPQPLDRAQLYDALQRLFE